MRAARQSPSFQRSQTEEAVAIFQGKGHDLSGPRLDEPLEMKRNGATSFYTADGLGSPILLTDAIGAVTERYSYDVYGTPTIRNAAGIVLTSSTLKNPFLFTAREWDPETSLSHYRARYYSPKLGRFLSYDPLGQLPSPNLYTYVENSPVNRLDPFGLLMIITPPPPPLLPIPIINCPGVERTTANPTPNTPPSADPAENPTQDGEDDQGSEGKRNPKQDRKLTQAEIQKLIDAGIDPEELKGGKSTGQWDLYKDSQGNIYIKPKGGSGPGEPTGVNINWI